MEKQSQMTTLVTRIIAKIVRSKKPSFIMSVDFLNPKSSRIISLHRRLFFLSCCRPINLIINLIAYARWVGYYTWVLSYKASTKQTEEQLQEYGLTRLELFLELVKLGLIHIIPPRYYFIYQFYKNNNKKKILNYVYNQQQPYFHDNSNRNFKQYKQDVKLIGDKYQFTIALQKIDIPTVSSELCNTLALKQRPWLLLQKKAMFVKPNIGSKSKDAFLIEYDSGKDKYELTPIHGSVMKHHFDIECYLKKIVSRHNTLLLQPMVSEHAEIKKISSQNASTTVRIITGKSASSPCIPPKLLYLQLEIPCVKEKKSIVQYYTILPLDLNTLDIDPVFKCKSSYYQENDQVISDELKLMMRTAINYCVLAHHKLLNLRSVSFDVILSEEGPVILEANYNWSVEMLYNVIQTDPFDQDDMHPAAQWLNSNLSK